VKTPVKILNKKELMNLAGDETRSYKKRTIVALVFAINQEFFVTQHTFLMSQ